MFNFWFYIKFDETLDFGPSFNYPVLDGIWGLMCLSVIVVAKKLITVIVSLKWIVLQKFHDSFPLLFSRETICLVPWLFSEGIVFVEICHLNWFCISLSLVLCFLFQFWCNRSSNRSNIGLFAEWYLWAVYMGSSGMGNKSIQEVNHLTAQSI